MRKQGIKVFAPASVANVAVGYDILGFAIDGPGDEIIARPAVGESGVYITKIHGDKGKLPKETLKNTAGFAGQKVLEHIGAASSARIELEIFKKMPFGSGLGSSAASAVAGAMAVNEIMERPLSKRELLPFAVAGEEVADGAYHADNVAPSLLGGLILIRDNASLDLQSIHIPKGLLALVVYPYINILTKDARNIIADTVPLSHFIAQTGNVASFVLGMQTSNYELIKRSMTDLVIERQRASLIPHFYPIKDAMLHAGALGCSISGAGPSIFGLFNNTLLAEKAQQSIHEILTTHSIEHDFFLIANK